MESTNIDIKELTKIPEQEFKQHFRNWMEQDEVARSLQAKLRKDLIVNFNKTSLGKKIILQTGISQRLNLSPLLLALNTLAAEFLYAQNCHFTLSVFCTEVPYRNTLPDFESARHFRFSEREIFEILDALSSNLDMDTKQTVCKEYTKKINHSLLFVVIKQFLSKAKENEHPPAASVAASPEKLDAKEEKPQKSKIEHQSKNFRYLNKYLMILSKKMKEMSKNLDVLQNKNQTVKKSIQTRKFENLNRNLEKISENLRHLSVSKRKNKRLSAVITAVNTMARQFEKCLLNFDQVSKGLTKGVGLSNEKSYSDWIHEMRTTDNGKIFLEKIESSLRKTLHRERKKMECELDQRIQIQKDILKAKYKQKLTEQELAVSTSRGKAADSHQANEVFEKKLNEFEAKHKELHLKIQEAEKRLIVPPVTHDAPDASKNKITQTAKELITKPNQIVVDSQDQLQQMVKSISEQERQVDHIVFDAKLRVQELEHESNQIDRSFQDYLERQRSEKQKMRENATSIWQSYALGKSMLDTKDAPHLLTSVAKVEKHPVKTFDKITPVALSIPTINIDKVSVSASTNPPVFENPFRVAQRKVLSRSKTTYPPALPLTDTDSSAEKCTRHKRKQRPTVLRLIEHKDKYEHRTKTPPLMSSRNDAIATKLTQVTQLLSPELNIEEGMSLDGIELSPTTAKSSSVRSVDSNSSERGVFKLKRQLFTTVSNNERGGSPPSTSYAQQMNSMGNKELKEPLLQINKHQNGAADDKKKSTEAHTKDVAVNKVIMERNSEIKASEVSLGPSTGVGMVTPLIMAEEDVSTQIFYLNIPITELGKENISNND